MTSILATWLEEEEDWEDWEGEGVFVRCRREEVRGRTGRSSSGRRRYWIGLARSAAGDGAGPGQRVLAMATISGDVRPAELVWPAEVAVLAANAKNAGTVPALRI